MNFPYFISDRIHSHSSTSFARVISRLAIISISVGVAAMILAFFILGGFQQTIRAKIFDFKGHLEVTKYAMSSSMDEKPIALTDNWQAAYPLIHHVQAYAHKAGLLKTKEEVEGILFKGIDDNFDSLGFAKNMVAGRTIDYSMPQSSKEIVISKTVSDKLRLKLGDRVTIHFIQNPPRYRRMSIVGIYETGLEEIDKQLVLGDLAVVQKLNNWADTLAAGYEVFLKDERDTEEALKALHYGLDNDLYVDRVSDIYAQFFDWLQLLNQNVTVFLSLILFVASINMISILLILIMERTYMIGVLQALGTNMQNIQRIFFNLGWRLMIKGLLIGNILALVLAYLQDQFHLIPLDHNNYYMYFVPILWDFEALLLVNLLTLMVVAMSLLIPLGIITRFKPSEALRFD